MLQDDPLEAEGARPVLAGEGSDIHEEANVTEEGIFPAIQSSFPSLRAQILQSSTLHPVRSIADSISRLLAVE